MIAIARDGPSYPCRKSRWHLKERPQTEALDVVAEQLLRWKRDPGPYGDEDHRDLAQAHDLGAKADVHLLLRDLARQGTALVVISSDLPEVLALADRIVVMREGRVSAELSRSEATEERIMYHATRHGA